MTVGIELGYPNPDAKESILTLGNNGLKVDWYGQPNPNTTLIEGIAVLDHPENLSYPTLWRPRVHGRFAPSISGRGPVELPQGKTLRLRYGVYVHGDQPAAAIEARWQAFATTELDHLTPPRSPPKNPTNTLEEKQ